MLGLQGRVPVDQEGREECGNEEEMRVGAFWMEEKHGPCLALVKLENAG
jgi:hypothetical protein